MGVTGRQEEGTAYRCCTGLPGLEDNAGVPTGSQAARCGTGVLQDRPEWAQADQLRVSKQRHHRLL